MAPRISFLGASLRYAATPLSAVLNSEVISQAFQDVVRSQFKSMVTTAGLDETMYFLLRSGGIGNASMQRYRHMQLSKLIGWYAEKRVQITGGWKPTSKPNFSQVDVYNYENNRFIGVQVKTHGNTNWKGSPKPLEGLVREYVKDMEVDNKANKFLIPDDHYEPTLQHLREMAEQARAAGDTNKAAFFERQAQRLGKIGATYDQLESEAQLAAKVALARSISARVGWVITGVLVTRSVYMDFNAFQTGRISGSELAYKLGQDALGAGSGIVGSYLGKILFKGSPWGVGGTAAVCVLIVQEGFLILQYGSFENAFSQPQFWIVTAGNVGGAGLGLAGAIYVGQLGACLGSAFGPVGTGVGATIGATVGGGAGAMIGSYGGSEISRIALDLCSPDWVYAEYNQKIDTRLRELKTAMN